MSNSYNINFQGGFLIKNPSIRMWNGIKESMPRKKVILENLNNDGDKFFSIKTCYDKEIAYMLLKKKANFKFYPDINLKLRIDPYYPNEAKEIINSQERVLEGSKDIRKYFNAMEVKQKPISKYRWKPNDHIEQTLKALETELGIKKENCAVKIEQGKTIIYDKSGNIIAKASPNSEKGFNYVYVLPKNEASNSKRLVVNNSGEIVHRFSILDFQNFQKHFMRNVKIDNGRKRPQKL